MHHDASELYDTFCSNCMIVIGNWRSRYLTLVRVLVGVYTAACMGGQQLISCSCFSAHKGVSDQLGQILLNVVTNFYSNFFCIVSDCSKIYTQEGTALF